MRYNNITGAAAAALLLTMGACRPAAVVDTGPAGLPAPAALPMAGALPQGTVLDVRLNQRLDTRTTQIGSRFSASLVSPLTTTTGEIVVPAGAIVAGTVTGLQPSGRIGEPAAIRLDFDVLQVGSRSYPFGARVLHADTEVDRSPRLGRAPVIGAAAGAVLGAIVSGGELERILIGGVLGAGAGTIIALGTGDVDAALPTGTTMRLQTTETVSLR